MHQSHPIITCPYITELKKTIQSKSNSCTWKMDTCKKLKKIGERANIMLSNFMRLNLKSMPFANKLEYIYGFWLLQVIQLVVHATKKYCPKEITQKSTGNFVLCNVVFLDYFPSWLNYSKKGEPRREHECKIYTSHRIAVKLAVQLETGIF